MEKDGIDFDSLFSGKPSSPSQSVVVSRDDDFDLEPLPDVSFAEFGDFQLVGHGEVTNDYCGRFKHFFGCSRVELHDKIMLDGENCKGKVFMKKVFLVVISLVAQFVINMVGRFVKLVILRGVWLRLVSVLVWWSILLRLFRLSFMV